jgi:hypothetical protein
MKKYAVSGLSASGTGPQTAVALIGATTYRPLLSEITLGFRTNPNATDQQVRWAVSNFTGVGTAGSSPTPKPLDPQDVAASVTAGIAHSGEPTLGANFLDGDLNQRGAFRWVAEIGFEIAGALTASNGLSARMVAVTAAIVMSAPVAYKE